MVWVELGREGLPEEVALLWDLNDEEPDMGAGVSRQSV